MRTYTTIFLFAAILLSGCANNPQFSSDPIKRECAAEATTHRNNPHVVYSNGAYRYKGYSKMFVQANYEKCVELGGVENYRNSDYVKPKPGSWAEKNMPTREDKLKTCENVLGVGSPHCNEYR